MTMPNFRLDQQTALVTGAASGIGRGIALGLPPPARMSRASICLNQRWKRSATKSGCWTGCDRRTGRCHGCRHPERCGPGRGERTRPLSLAVNSAGIANAAPAEEMS